MNLISVSMRNVRVRLLSSTLTMVSIALGTALLCALWLLIAETNKKYTASLLGYEAVVGPKEGSPLSLVLSTVYNLGAEPGVVPMSVYRELHDGDLGRSVGIRHAIPQARGDTYRGFPIIGTTDEMFTKFGRGYERIEVEEGRFRTEPHLLRFADGGPWSFGHDEFVAFAEEKARELAEHEAGTGDHDHAHEPIPPKWRQAVIGEAVARVLGLSIGSKIVPVHGRYDEVAHHHEEAETEVVGILAPTGTPIDRSIFVPMNLFLSMDQHQAIRADQQEAEAGNVMLSAIVVAARDRLGGSRLRRVFQTRSDAQVAWTSVEVSSLLEIVGNATDILRVVSYLVLAVAAISVLVALYNTMNERRREIAIMRSLGARRNQILRIILAEALFVSLAGGVCGVAICHVAAWLLNPLIAAATSVSVDWTAFSLDELWLILGVTLLGGMAGVLPAIKGSMTEVADNLGPVS